MELVDLVGTNILPPDMQRLVGLAHLKILNLPGPMWNTGAGARIDYSRELRHLAGIHTLEELTFSYTYLESIKFQDEGIAEIAPLGPSLKVLSLENTNVRGHELSPFTNLEALDLVYCPIDDKGLKQLQGLTKLKKLLLRDAVISDEGLQHVRPLRDLESLDLGGTKITDAGLAHLQEMTKLKKLNLQGALITDVGIRRLARMTNLEELNLYGTKITNTGLDVLATLQSLRAVDLRYTRVSRAGVDRLHTTVPACELNFREASVRPALPTGAEKIVAGQGDAAVAAWVRAIGGRAVVHGERCQLRDRSHCSPRADAWSTDDLLAET